MIDRNLVLELAGRAGIRLDSFNCPVIDNQYQLLNFAEIMVRECANLTDSDAIAEQVISHFGITS